MGDSAFFFFLKVRVKRDHVASAIPALVIVVILFTLTTGIVLILGTTITNEVDYVIRDNDFLITCIQGEGPCNYLTYTLWDPFQARVANVDENIVEILGIAVTYLNSIITIIILQLTNCFIFNNYAYNDILYLSHHGATE